MKHVFTFISVLFFLVAPAQTAYYAAYDAGMAMSMEMRALTKTLDGGMAMLSADSVTKIMKTDINGTLQWQKILKGLYMGSALRILQDQVDSSYYAFSFHTLGSGFLVSKISKTGNLLLTWSSVHYPQMPSGACVAKTGGIVSVRGIPGAIRFVKTSPNGDVTWVKEYQDFNTLPQSALIQCHNGDFVAVGAANNGSQDPCAIRIDSLGNLKWYKVYTMGSSQDKFTALAETVDSTLIGMGPTDGNYEWFYMRMDSLGEPLNFRKYRSSHSNSIFTLMSGTRNRFIFGGMATYPGFINTQNHYCYADYTGTPIWSKTSGNSLYNSGGADYILTGDKNTNNSFIFAGYGEGKSYAMVDSMGNGYCNADTLIFATSAGSIGYLSVPLTTVTALASTYTLESSEFATPMQFNMYCQVTTQLSSNTTKVPAIGVFPNPSEGVFKIELETGTILQLSLCNTNGEFIVKRKEFDTPLIDVSFLKAGVYSLLIHTSEGTYQKKIVIIH